MPYRSLDPEKIVSTLETLEQRIAERFPGSGLVNVCSELTQIARDSRERAALLAKANVPLRIISAAIVIGGLLVLAYVASIIEIKRDAENLFGVLQGIEALMNTVVIVGAAVIFLVSLEARWKRQQALGDLHELRSVIHVIDMHQLTKDPSRITQIGASTQHSPKRTLTPFELFRYLDYCSEMLSLSAKVAALYAQSSKDSIVVEAASDLGQITSNLSQKIWQKISLIRMANGDVDPPVAPAPHQSPAAVTDLS
ncbi:MAG: hypothetical protein RLZ98_1554 [Pseudomonadota bacterium]|jgi:hypothetical protein